MFSLSVFFLFFLFLFFCIVDVLWTDAVFLYRHFIINALLFDVCVINGVWVDYWKEQSSIDHTMLRTNLVTLSVINGLSLEHGWAGPPDDGDEQVQQQSKDVPQVHGRPLDGWNRPGRESAKIHCQLYITATDLPLHCVVHNMILENILKIKYGKYYCFYKNNNFNCLKEQSMDISFYST